MKKLVMIGMLVLLSACSSKGTKDDAAAGVEDKSSAPAGTIAKPLEGDDLAGKAAALDPRLRDPNNILSKRIVYFEYDSYVIKEEYKPLIQAHAKYLSENKDARVALQGNADERGSREYNLSLGQKRAESTKKAMQVLGVQEVQIESISFGEEKPVCTETNEACWAKNRRAEIVYQGE
jgi:peptidoglycan-associated lipoprotein